MCKSIKTDKCLRGFKEYQTNHCPIFRKDRQQIKDNRRPDNYRFKLSRNVDIEVKSKEIEARASSGGEIIINGTCEKITADASSSGRINALLLGIKGRFCKSKQRRSYKSLRGLTASRRMRAAQEESSMQETQKLSLVSQSSGGIVQKRWLIMAKDGRDTRFSIFRISLSL